MYYMNEKTKRTISIVPVLRPKSPTSGGNRLLIQALHGYAPEDVEALNLSLDEAKDLFHLLGEALQKEERE
jgi:hypothetical protein